jgi:glucokinase
VFLVTLGTGIGGGVVTDGRLQRGHNGFAGEPGHMVVDPDGPPCPCGRRGCWERFASGSGLGRLAREAAESGRGRRLVELAGHAEAVRGEHVSAAAREGDPEALEVFRQLGWWAALGIANLVNLLDPEIVVVGGGLIEAGDIVLTPIRTAFGELVLAAEHRPEVPIVPAELGGDAGAIGAALIGFDRAG